MIPFLADASTIAGDSLIPLAGAGAALVMVVSFTMWLQRQFTDLRALLTAIQVRMDSLEKDSHDRVLRIEFELWIERLRSANPTITVPDFPKRDG